MTVLTTNERFRRARDIVISMSDPERAGIGTQKEKTLHAVLKNYFDDDPSHQEISADVFLEQPNSRFIADIYHNGRITEIQTADFQNLRGKLPVFLACQEVTVVYPIACRKWVIWIDPKTGELGKKNRSPAKGSYFQAFRELYKIRSILTDPVLSPALTIHLMLIDMEEYRIQDGWGREGRRGSHRYDLIPLEIIEEKSLHTREDYASLIPDHLTEPFTAKQLSDAAGVHRRGVSFSQVLLMLYELGVVERIGRTRQGAYLYRRADISAGISEGVEK